MEPYKRQMQDANQNLDPVGMLDLLPMLPRTLMLPMKHLKMLINMLRLSNTSKIFLWRVLMNKLEFSGIIEVREF